MQILLKNDSIALPSSTIRQNMQSTLAYSNFDVVSANFGFMRDFMTSKKFFYYSKSNKVNNQKSENIKIIITFAGNHEKA